jgi:hypothetical protein
VGEEVDKTPRPKTSERSGERSGKKVSTNSRLKTGEKPGVGWRRKQAGSHQRLESRRKRSR